MHILYVALKYDYNKPEQGLSFEHYNFYETLVHMGHAVSYFDFGTLSRELGRAGMNRRLLETARAEKPDLIFSVLIGDEFDFDTWCELASTGPVTLNWFTDDHWRFENFSQLWAPCFHWVVTTSQRALAKYKQHGIRNVIKSQWACNHFTYRPQELPLVYDVSFVGMAHGDRREVMRALERAGITARVWGSGWDAGRLDQSEMLRVFSQSKINLNFTNAINIPRKRRIMLWKNWRRHANNQIKGRTFEIPGCGGFLLTGDAENLRDYYADGKELVIFRNTDDLIHKAKYYLAHEQERAQIARAGCARTLRDHTYEKRFREIFARIGLPDALTSRLCIP